MVCTHSVYRVVHPFDQNISDPLYITESSSDYTVVLNTQSESGELMCGLVGCKNHTLLWGAMLADW